MRAEAAKLMHAGEAGNDDVVLGFDVPCKAGIVREDVVIGDLAIMGDVGVGQNEVIVADASWEFFVSAAMDRDVFTEDVAITDFESGGLARIF